MTVARILAAKGRDVVTTRPYRTLGEAVDLLAEKRIGALVVTDADLSVLGILSERDIVRALSEVGSHALDEAVSKHMTARVVTVDERTTVDAVMETMTTGRFRHAPVVEGGRIVGLVSIGDVVKHHIADIETEQRVMREYIATA